MPSEMLFVIYCAQQHTRSMACLTRVEVISPLSTMFWIREAFVVPDDLHAMADCVNRNLDDAGNG